jgi:hypothetical protein
MAQGLKRGEFAVMPQINVGVLTERRTQRAAEIAQLTESILALLKQELEKTSKKKFS